MTPEQIYIAITTNEAITSRRAIVEKMICSCFDSCFKAFLCETYPKSKMLDFDLVEKTWHILKGEPSSSSTDGLTYTPQHLCFIEAKGWKKFLEHQPELQKESINDQEGSRVYYRIKKQTQKYHFQKKLLESISICEEIVGNNSIINCVPIRYLLVTDINITPNNDSQQDFASHIFQQLNFLATTSTKWETICVNEMKDKFKRDIDGIKGIEARFIQCNQLDEYLSNPLI